RAQGQARPARGLRGADALRRVASRGVRRAGRAIRQARLRHPQPALRRAQDLPARAPADRRRARRRPARGARRAGPAAVRRVSAPTSEADFERARRAVAYGWTTESAVERALAAADAPSSRGAAAPGLAADDAPITSRITLSPAQRRALLGPP